MLSRVFFKHVAVMFFVAIACGCVLTNHTLTSLAFAETNTTELVTVSVYYKTTTGASLGSAWGKGVPGTLLSTQSSSGSSIANNVDTKIASLQKDGYTISSKGGWNSAGVFPNKDAVYTIVFKAPSSNTGGGSSPSPKPVITTNPITVIVKLTNPIDGSSGTARGTAVPGTKFSKKGTDGKSLVDRVNGLIAWQKEGGFVPAKKGTTWPGDNGVFPSKNTTYTITFTQTEKPVFWMYNKKTGENLYTAATTERYALSAKAAWQYKGIVWYAPTKGEPVYRLVNKKTNDHHFTKSKKEADTLVKRGTWQKDFSGKPAFYSGGTKSVWRLRHDVRIAKWQAGTHRFATSTSAVNALAKSGWKSEGVLLKAVRYK